eukprot:SAG31_NODE_749_length_12378_cov_8.688818_6_plen_982_part_00
MCSSDDQVTTAAGGIRTAPNHHAFLLASEEKVTRKFLERERWVPDSGPEAKRSRYVSNVSAEPVAVWRGGSNSLGDSGGGGSRQATQQQPDGAIMAQLQGGLAARAAGPGAWVARSLPAVVRSLHSPAAVAARSAHARTLLPTPSEEQREVIEAVRTGHCVAVSSVAGSGKTTCMLQVAANLPERHVTIVSYNRELRDECVLRIRDHGLDHHVKSYTIHGLASKCSDRTLNDDTKLMSKVVEWDRGLAKPDSLRFDLLMIDEAQDLRPSFFRALSHVLQARTNAFDSLQICVFGDSKQLLYDLPTYGEDKAVPFYLENPEPHWRQFTQQLLWIQKRLSTSYRLTPKIADFVNVVWGTEISGGNTTSPNIPVEYLCRYPYPGEDKEQKLPTRFLADLIDKHGPENVMLLAQSVKNDKCPIRVHVNHLMQMKTHDGLQKYNFHVKVSDRGFNDSDVTNKVKVWTFCGSKGCEAEVVVVFGFDMIDTARVTSLNQMGVALSRAKSRLIVIHGQGFNQRMLCPNGYYPLRGAVGAAPGDSSELKARSNKAQQAVADFVARGVVKPDPVCMPTVTRIAECEPYDMVYVATDFTHFSAAETTRFLKRAQWTKEGFGVTRDENRNGPAGAAANMIQYASQVQFQQTTEDVSAIYGNALPYLLQWQRDGFCPHVEQIVHDGMLCFHPQATYTNKMVGHQIIERCCDDMSERDAAIYHAVFKEANKGRLSGKTLVELFNRRLHLTKRRVLADGREIVFRVKAVEERVLDEIMKQHIPTIAEVYRSPEKTAADWCYIANAVQAFDNYHDKFTQIGTDPLGYQRWVSVASLEVGLARLQAVMAGVPAGLVETETTTGRDEEGNDGFETELRVEFATPISIPPNPAIVVGVAGAVDWVGTGLRTPTAECTPVDLLEIKFVQELGDAHRLQVLIYCALYAEERGQVCSGMLYNVRTDEVEVCKVRPEDALELLLDLSVFKYNGTKRQPLPAGLR